MKKFLLTCLMTLGIAVMAQTNVANYTFSKSTGVAYTPITGGTVFISGTYDNQLSAAIPLPTPFPFGGTTVNSCYISANGYITFGAVPVSSTYTPLSTLDPGTTGAIAAFAQDGGTDITANTTASPQIMYKDLGTEFVIQYQDHANYYNRSTEKLNFQIRLVYATGAINIIYGSCTNPGTTSTSGTAPQVGIRGNSVAYATNVSPLMIGNVPASTTCDWSKAVTGNVSSSSLLFSGTTNVNVKIPSGLQYTWTPGTLLPVRTFAATTAVTNAGATLSWTAPTGATTYNVQYRVLGDCDWTNFSGNPVAATTAALTGLNQATTYQVQVQALNGTALATYSHIPDLAGTGNGYAAAGSFTTLINCTSTVTGLASSAITPDAATISWTASTTVPGNGYEYYYSTSSTAPVATTTPSGSVGAGVVTTNLTGLTPATKYYYWVRGNCNGVDKGAWSSSANFTTITLCPTVSAPAAAATGVSVTPTITWTALTGVTGYKLKVGTTSGGNDVLDSDLGNVTTYTFSTPLNNGTQYYYSVTGYTATTAAPVTPCTVRNFTTILSCLSTVTGLASSAITPDAATISWTASTTVPGNGYEYYYSTSSTAPVATTTPSGSVGAGVVTTNLTGLTPATKYYYWVRGNCNGVDKGAWSSSANFTTITLCPTVSAPTAAATGVSVTPTITWTALTGVTGYKLKVGTTSGGNDVLDSDLGNVNTYTFSTPLNNGTQYYYSVTGYTATTAAPVTPCTVRNFTTILSCLSTVTGLASSAITVNTATISWTASTTVPGNGYEYYYSTSSTAPVATTTPSGSVGAGVTTANLSGLTAATPYYYWVRGNCNGVDKGAWSSSANFTTLCGSAALNVPYTQDFETSVTPAIPSCTTIENVGTGNNWGTASNNGYGFTTKALLYTYNSSSAANAWFYTPGINLVAGTQYTISYKYGGTSSSYVEKLKVMYGSSAASTAMTNPIADYPNVVNSTPITESINFTPTTSGVYYFGFNAYSIANRFYLAVDDISIVQTTILSTIETNSLKNNIKAYPNPFADVLNISDVKNVKSVSVVDIAGRIVKTIEKPSSALQLGDLKSGMYMVILNMNDGSTKTIKVIKQ